MHCAKPTVCRYFVSKINKKGNLLEQDTFLLFTNAISSFLLDKPEIVGQPSTIVNEGDRVILAREIVSNPLSNVSWYNGTELLKTMNSVKNATLVIKKALCTDTKNFTLVAGNTVDRNVTALVELIVNCECYIYYFKEKFNNINIPVHLL